LRLPWGWNTGDPGPLEGAETLGDWPAPQDLHNTHVEPICRKYLEVRYQLLPYLYSAAEQTHRTGLPLMRALWTAFPRDARCVAVTDQYLLGDHLLVAPVLEAGATHRKTYLPSGTWWDYWTNERVSGGTELNREVDLATIPLYVRAGACIPIGPLRQYAMEPSKEILTLRIYPGADGRSTLYDDDGTSFRYRQGEFTRLECSWDNASRTLQVTSSKAIPPSRAKDVRIQAMDNGTVKRITIAHQSTTVEL
jgi:alpha-glucosidase/alpha-D-xyloside xylohydrolase